jgi:hypothetical protein
MAAPTTLKYVLLKKNYSPYLPQQITLLPIEFEAGLHVPE